CMIRGDGYSAVPSSRRLGSTCPYSVQVSLIPPPLHRRQHINPLTGPQAALAVLRTRHEHRVDGHGNLLGAIAPVLQRLGQSGVGHPGRFAIEINSNGHAGTASAMAVQAGHGPGVPSSTASSWPTTDGASR